MSEPDIVKTTAEVIGSLMTMLSAGMMGRTGRVQRWGVIIAMVAVVPWTVFAVVTTSWLMVGQSVVLAFMNGINLMHLSRRSRHAS